MSESAYEIARRHGYRFSEEQWLKSLGRAGDKGPRGERGDRGPRGLPGADGRNGIDGRDGRNGIDGKDGLNGLNGVLPEPVPWTGIWERDMNRMTTRIRVKSVQGAWDAVITRDPTQAIQEVEFIPVI